MERVSYETYDDMDLDLDSFGSKKKKKKKKKHGDLDDLDDVSASKVINNSLQGWCSVYECSDETSFKSGILTIFAAKWMILKKLRVAKRHYAQVKVICQTM